MKLLNKRLNYPIKDLAGLYEQREFFLRVRKAYSHAVTFENHRYIYAVVDSNLDFNARLIRQAELDALGHLATSGAWLV